MVDWCLTPSLFGNLRCISDANKKSGLWVMMTTRLIFASIISFLMVPAASAGGLYLREFGTPSQGTATAGAPVLAEDASTAFSNPAGVFKLEGDAETMVTGLFLHSSTKFSDDNNNTVKGNNGGDAGGNIVGGAFYHARKLDDKWGVTVALNSLSGSALDFDDGFYGRYTGDEVDLLTVTLATSLAYKVNDELAVSFGIAAIYGQLELEAAIPRLVGGEPTPATDGRAKIKDGDDYDFTPTASLLWQAADDWRFSLGYLGENTLRFNSDLDLKLAAGVGRNDINADVKIKIPQSIVAGGMHEVNDKLSLLARLAWEDWSTLESVPITTSKVDGAIPLNWDDVWSLSLGYRYKNNDRWTTYAGVAFDSDPTEADDRVSILPADRQVRYAAGFTYKIDAKRQIGSTLTYIDLGSAKTNNVNSDRGTFSGKYSTNELYVFGVNYNWR
jgi:long-chain fatty acid transport protein